MQVVRAWVGGDWLLLVACFLFIRHWLLPCMQVVRAWALMRGHDAKGDKESVQMSEDEAVSRKIDYLASMVRARGHNLRGMGVSVGGAAVVVGMLDRCCLFQLQIVANRWVGGSSLRFLRRWWQCEQEFVRKCACMLVCMHVCARVPSRSCAQSVHAHAHARTHSRTHAHAHCARECASVRGVCLRKGRWHSYVCASYQFLLGNS
jgi:hypothetical protein